MERPPVSAGDYWTFPPQVVSGANVRFAQEVLRAASTSVSPVRRVVVTGLGAVTPIGNDARATWESAVAGRSGIDWIRSFDPGDSPVRIAGEVKDFDPTGLDDPRELRRLDRYVLLALGRVRGAAGAAAPAAGSAPPGGGHSSGARY